MLTKYAAVSAAVLHAAAQAVEFSVASTGGNATSPYQYGLMFEDINNSGDGGVYAELIQNRAFQGDEIFPKNLDYWNSLGSASLKLQNLSTPLSPALTTSLEVSAGEGDDTVGFSNVGFWGFPVVASWEYKGSFWLYGSFSGDIEVCLVSNSDEKFAEASVPVSSTTSDGWMQFNYTLQPTLAAPNSNNTLNFTFPASAADGPVNFNLLSLFPPTYKGRENGLRIDLMEAMAGLNPSFFRMPGGNNIEGLQSPYWWNWTKTLGPLEGRSGYPGTWGYENTDGLGLIEYLLWAQDLGMEPILGVWSGLWLDGTVVPEDQLQPYVDAALDEIEFCMGDASTTWGAQREALGYGPFPIKFVEIGNEDSLNGGASTYSAYRFAAFESAILAKYPDMNLISSFFDVGPVTPPNGASGDYHEYAVPIQMAGQFGYFDNYTSENKVLIGEYAVVAYSPPGVTQVMWDAGAPRAYVPFWYGSVAEAVFLLGAERNSDKMIGASYAPSFMNWNRWEWVPNLMQYDADPAHTTLGTSYYMIQLLSGTRITQNLPMTLSANTDFDPAFWVAGTTASGSHVVKAAVYNSSAAVPFQVSFDGVRRGTSAKLTYLTAPMNATNPVGGNVVETHTEVVRAGRDGSFSFTLPEWSVAVFETEVAQRWGHGGGQHGPGGKHGPGGW